VGVFARLLRDANQMIEVRHTEIVSQNVGRRREKISRNGSGG
jgi:hypothetical protein